MKINNTSINNQKCCEMYIIESGKTMDIFWECNNCLKQFEATVEFENNKYCPSCNSRISEWIYFE